MLNRVRYFSPDDGCYGYMLDRIESINVPDYEDIDINDAIEYYQISKYFKTGIPLKLRKTWTDEQFKEYSEKSNFLFGMANRFFSDLSDENIFDRYCQIDSFYETVFWEIFDSRKFFDRLSLDVFEKILQYHEDAIFTVLTYSKIVKNYGALLRKYILNHLSCIDLILQYYEQDDCNGGNKRIYLPEEFSEEDILDFLNRYLESKDVNPKYADAIHLIQNNNKIHINDNLRLKAKQRSWQEWNKKANNCSIICKRLQVIFSPDQKEIKKISYDTNEDVDEITYCYSSGWLSRTFNPSIINNFIYVFEFVDSEQMRCLHTFNKLESSAFEQINQPELLQHIYPENIAFNLKNDLASKQMEAYYYFLLSKGIRYENVIEWFFTEYLQKTLSCPEIRLSMPSKDSTILEKCVMICTAIEIVVKQFSQYAIEHKIDFELLDISSTSFKFDKIPSLLEGKYIYGGDDLKKWIYLLFSDQCFLIYKDLRYSCFLELLMKESIYKKDCSENEKLYIDQLVNADLIKIAEDGKIQLGNQMKLRILKDLNDHGVINRWHYPHNVQMVFQEWIQQGILEEKSTLLSQQEADYFSYFLNREKYTNGFDIRNRYVHGNGQIITDEDTHKANYNILLRLITILVIKINDDCCLYLKMQNENSHNKTI